LSGCRGHRVLACLGLALAGLAALSSLLDASRATELLQVSLAIASLALLIVLVDSLLAATLILLLAVLTLASKAILSPPIFLIPLALIASVILTLSPRAPVILAGLGAILALSHFLVGSSVILALYVATVSLLALVATRRLHSLVLLLALAMIPVGLEQALAASLLATILVVAAGGFIERVGCPFKVDSRLVFWGGVVASLGIVAMAVGGVTTLTSGLWILGLLLTLSGILVPSTPVSV